MIVDDRHVVWPEMVDVGTIRKRYRCVWERCVSGNVNREMEKER
jgi:hypothetical protein